MMPLRFLESERTSRPTTGERSPALRSPRRVNGPPVTHQQHPAEGDPVRSLLDDLYDEYARGLTKREKAGRRL